MFFSTGYLLFPVDIKIVMKNNFDSSSRVSRFKLQPVSGVFSYAKTLLPYGTPSLTQCCESTPASFMRAVLYCPSLFVPGKWGNGPHYGFSAEDWRVRLGLNQRPSD